MTIWVAIPTVNPKLAAEKVEAWRDMGYSVALSIEERHAEKFKADFVEIQKHYTGYYPTVNRILKHLIRDLPVAVAAADDMWPDPELRAPEIRDRFLERFKDTFGVLQPTGDDLDGTDRICGSPWLGRAFIRESYRGNGPFYYNYRQFFADDELIRVVRRLECFEQAPDITQKHDHWTRPKAPPPTDYQRTNQGRYWDRDAGLFKNRKAADFPESERIKCQKPSEPSGA